MDLALSQLINDAETARFSVESLANALFSVAASSFDPSTWSSG